MSDRDELSVLIEQLDELLSEGATNADEALEIASVAGLAERLGASGSELAEAVAWRGGPGGPLLEQAFAELQLDQLVDAIDDLTGGPVEDEVVEEAVYDFDDVVAAAVWAGRPDLVRAAAKRVAAIVRELPDPFVCLGYDGKEMAKTPAVALNLDVYDYWLALADAGEWAA